MHPVLFRVGSFAVPTYGLLVALGFLAGLWVTKRLARRVNLPADDITNLAVYCAMAGIVGAKLFMFLFDLGDYIRHPEQIFTMETLQAAGVFHGGFVAAFLVAIWFVRRKHLPAFTVMDCFAPGVALGQAIGRLGCFAAGCCWGKECSLPWGVRFHSQEAAPVPLDKTLHPAQLYESAADLLIFGILYGLFRRRERPGTVIGAYLVLYSSARFVIEFFREHEQSTWGPFSITQWIALALLCVGAGILVRRRRAGRAEGAVVVAG